MIEVSFDDLALLAIDTSVYTAVFVYLACQISGFVMFWIRNLSKTED